MKYAKSLLATVLVVGIVPSLMAVPISVLVDDTPKQDPLLGGTHELGVGFPSNELISATEVAWGGHVPCPADYQDGGAVQVQITNQSGRDWTNLVYVADPETTLSNDDGLIADATVPDVFTQAFNIDNLGANTPLVFESMVADNIFQAGETWEFVIQEYSSSLGLSEALLDSWDSNNNRGQVAGASAGGPPSSGSIIAIPEPGTLALLGVAGGIALFFRRLHLH